MKIRDRIIRLDRVRAGNLLPNPKNWRKHPDDQADAMRGLLAEIGFADAVLVRETPDGLQLIDGHLRAEIASDAVIPVLVLDVTPHEADIILASHDAVTGMAETDSDRLHELLSDLSSNNPAVQDLFDDLAAQTERFIVDAAEMPTLPEERGDYTQITFTLTHDQASDVRSALAQAKAAGPFVDTGNDNVNGNCLARLAESYLAT